MRETVADEAAHHDWSYEAIRPLDMPAKPWHSGQIVTGDCSKGCQYLAWWAGAPDPMGLRFGPYGNSQTMTLHLEHVDHPADLEVGDYVTFGPDGADHAAAVLEKGVDPLLWSFGHQGAPNTYRLSYDRRERHYLHNPAKPLLTPAEKLRLKTGYWSWLQWRLGEGAWKHHGKADAKVRPTIPKRIPLSWWRRYARYLLNRRSGNKLNPETVAVQARAESA